MYPNPLFLLPMIFYPNAKINLGLQVIGKREDGFHNLETIFLPIAVYDILELLDNKPHTFNFSSTGLTISTDNSSNLCVKAYHLLKQNFEALPTLSMHLHKQIVMGAGLGGGSANGAFVLKAINELFNLGLTEEALLKYALQLGSDCPFFIINKPCYATGRGEVLTPTTIPDLVNKKLVIINPNIHINTGWAFGKLQADQPTFNLQQEVQNPIELWEKTITNHFENSVFEAHPSIQKIKEKLYNLGAIYASLTGTGSTVYGIFEDPIEETLLQEFDSSYIKLITHIIS